MRYLRPYREYKVIYGYIYDNILQQKNDLVKFFIVCYIKQSGDIALLRRCNV